jgi:hypothetical protein
MKFKENYAFDSSNLSWMWEFFAEPQKYSRKIQPELERQQSLQQRLEKFWKMVVEGAEIEFNRNISFKQLFSTFISLNLYYYCLQKNYKYAYITLLHADSQHVYGTTFVESLLSFPTGSEVA